MRVAVVVLLLASVARADGEQDALEILKRGIEMFKTDQLAQARELFTSARALAPDKANPYRWLGLTEARLGHCREAVGNLDAFLRKIRPDDPRVIEAITVRDSCKAQLAAARPVETRPVETRPVVAATKPVETKPIVVAKPVETKPIVVAKPVETRPVVVEKKLEVPLTPTEGPARPRAKWPIGVGVVAAVVLAGGAVTVGVVVGTSRTEASGVVDLR